MTSGKKPLVFRINSNNQGPELVREVFLERGWVEFDEETQEESDWNMWWKTSRFRLMDYENILSWQRLNHYPKSASITKKDCLVRNLRRMKGVHGAGVYNFSPMSFNLPNDYTRYVAEYGKLKAKTDPKLFCWICKPADLSRGRGIFLFRDISELQYDCNAVVQQYIANPLLIGGYKFDIRLYVAVPSFHPLTIYMFQEGIVRFSTEKYDLSMLSNIFAHLTNTSINIHGPSYTADKERIGPGCKWTITQLRYYLHQNNIDDRLLWAKIINIVILTLLIQAPQVPKERNCYELYGFDILVDDTLKPWLLEVNFSPALNADCQVDFMVKKPMVHNLMDMLNFKESDGERGAIEKRTVSGRVTARDRMLSSRNKGEPIDRSTLNSRLSQWASMQRMNSMNTTITAFLKSIEPPMSEQPLSFIQQDNSSILKNNDETMCFGLPLVHPSDDEKADSDINSGRSSAKSAFVEPDLCFPNSSSSTSQKGSSQLNLERSHCSLERSCTNSSVIKTTDSVHSRSRQAEKESLKSIGTSDSAYSSFSDNSEKITIANVQNKSNNFSLHSEIKTAREDRVFKIRSLKPTENSKSLRKVSDRGTTPVISTLWNRTKVNVPNVDRSYLNNRSYDPISLKSNVNQSISRFGNNTHRSEMDINLRNRSKAVVSSMSTVIRVPREKEVISLGLTGMSKKPISNSRYRQRTKSISVHKTKGPPPRVGDFFLIFPFNEGTHRAANSTLDPHVVVKETQKLMKDLTLEVEKNLNDRKIGGMLPFGAPSGAERLWAPIKTVPEET